MKNDSAELHLEKRYFSLLVITRPLQYHTTLKVYGSYGLGLMKKLFVFLKE